MVHKCFISFKTEDMDIDMIDKSLHELILENIVLNKTKYKRELQASLYNGEKTIRKIAY